MRKLIENAWCHVTHTQRSLPVPRHEKLPLNILHLNKFLVTSTDLEEWTFEP